MSESGKQSYDFKMLRIAKYAERFDVGRTTIFEWIKKGILVEGHHFVKIGKTLRFFWTPEVIRDIHKRYVNQSASKNNHSISSATIKKDLNKKGTINLEY